MYRDVRTVVSELEEEDIRGEEQVFDDFEGVFDCPELLLYPATRIYEVVAGPRWGRDMKNIGKWRKLIVCLLSLCKLTEEVIKVKLPKLEEVTRGVMFDIYGTVFLFPRLP
eukprot:TRINITY_DN2148_c0_g1_i9.p5 TRINITY_DN2148_c0_g1~~TRINITY_DN2148_c0_g1_i9.p5  ORF type:complete len:111 (+),score=16.17 TRINITY_DN2148_c0_g1_i9:308-640(+)